jgi:hypothetical protein
MQGAQILRNEAYREVRCSDEGCSATQPFGFAQGREHVERQMDFLRSRQGCVGKCGYLSGDQRQIHSAVRL